MRTGIALSLMLTLMAGCASAPSNIKPVHTGETCTPAKRQRLAELSKIQGKTAMDDAGGVLMLGLPVGSMAGNDHSEEIARLKGACGVK